MKTNKAALRLSKIDQYRAVDEVYKRLREAIVTRQVSPGQRLNVDEISRQLGVSLTPVRSALELLAADGLVDVRPRSGTFVAVLRAGDVEETMDVRCALECLAAEKAVDRFSDRDLAAARYLLKTLAKPICNEEDRREHEGANSRLHFLLINAAGNRRLTEIYGKLNAHLTIARVHRTSTDWSRRTAQEQAEHEEIFGAMERRDGKALVEALRRHINRAKESLVAGIEAST